MGLYQRFLQPRLLSTTMNTGTLREIRERVCRGLSGNILEIGYGSGLNQPHLPPEVASVSAVEPSAVGFRLGEKRRTASPIPVTVVGDDAQGLPLPDDTFDGALCTWSLCGIPDPAAALREIRRVLKPGAPLHFVEHGLALDASVARSQRRFSRLNKTTAGCVLDLDVRALFDASDLTVTSMQTYYEKGSPKVAGFSYEGRATA
jgi:ubiquinone/menaquinone biosynthesis C-methylase UbiE